MIGGGTIAGMTVNERLYHFGLRSEFDAAVASRDVAAVVSVLLKAQLTNQQAHKSAIAILKKIATS